MFDFNGLMVDSIDKNINFAMKMLDHFKSNFTLDNWVTLYDKVLFPFTENAFKVLKSNKLRDS